MPLSNSYSESKRNLKSGFTLNEQELRRIIQVINEQFEKKNYQNSINLYTITHKNGLVAETDNLEDVFKIENVGSHQIIALTITVTTLEQSSNMVSITFTNKYSDDSDEDFSIKYIVRGEDRDWVMVTGSLIEDRFSKITSSQIFQKLPRSGFLVIIGLVMILFLTFLVNSLDKLDNRMNDTKIVLDKLEREYIKNKGIDVVKLIIEIEKSKYNNDNNLFVYPTYMMWSIIPLFILFVSFGVIKKIYLTYFPNCIFLWGDYIEKYSRLKRNRNLVLGIIFGTLILGVVVNMFSSFAYDRFFK